jgi:Carboxypeptidase regulatory-like domain/TonB dependent receptor
MGSGISIGAFKSCSGRSTLVIAMTACFSLFVVPMLFGQTSATIRGQISDQSGAVLPGVSISVKNQQTGIERTTLSDEMGNYQVAALPVGTYQIDVRLQGMKPEIIKGLVLEVDQVVIQNLKLQVGAVAEEVTVAAESATIDTSNIEVGGVISSKTVQEIPLNGRHFLDLGMLVPGSVTPPANAGLAAPLRGQGFFSFNTAGNREDGINFQLNGINLNDISNQQVTFQPSINTVDEFKVANGTFSAEYGRNSGGIVNVATRSGTNDFHGEAFEYLRNNFFDARNFFDLQIPTFRRNQYGGTFSGPIVKDKTFFFFSYEGLKHFQGLSLTSGVLTDAQRAAVTDPVEAKLLTLIPRANSGPSTFRGPAYAPVANNQFTLDISHRLSGSNMLHTYYANQRDSRIEPTSQGTETVPGFGDTRGGMRQVFTISETHTFGASAVNEARLGFNRIFITFAPNFAPNPTTDFGINDGIDKPLALPTITIGGIGLVIGGPGYSGRGIVTGALADTLTILKGRHSLKMGAEIRPSWSNQFSTASGSFSFANATTFLAGTANAFSQTLGDVDTSNLLRSVALFAQDSFKVSSNLTLDLGLRYDWFLSPKERYNRLIIFDPGTDSLLRVGSGINAAYAQSPKNFQPRLGFVWDPFKDGKMSVRGGYAILTEQGRDIAAALAGNPPLSIPLALPSGLTTTLERGFLDTQASGTISPTSIDKNFANSYVQSFNLNIQRQIHGGIALSAGYYGSKGTNMQITRNVNQFINGVRPFPRLSASSPISPGVGLTNITQRESGGNSTYNGLWLTAEKRFARGLSFNASYVLSKSLDYNSKNNQGVVVQDSYNLRGSKGLSDFDTRQRFVISTIYALPFKGNRAFEGWQVSTIVQDQTGNPLSLLSGSTSTTTISTLTGVSTIRPDLIAPVQMIRNPNQWFSNLVCDPTDPNNCPAGSAFAVPVSFVNGARVVHFGSVGRNTLTGPAFNDVDFSVLKNTTIRENLHTQFRWEVFDIFNHANFGNPGLTATPGSTTFGVIQSTRFPTGESGSSRQMQFTLKVLF